MVAMPETWSETMYNKIVEFCCIFLKPLSKTPPDGLLQRLYVFIDILLILRRLQNFFLTFSKPLKES